MLIHVMLNILLKIAQGKSSASKIGKGISGTKNIQWLSRFCIITCSIASWHNFLKNLVLLQVCDKVYLMTTHKERKITQCILCFTASYLLDVQNESRKAPISFLFQKQKNMGVPRILGYNSLSINPDTMVLRKNIS